MSHDLAVGGRRSARLADATGRRRLLCRASAAGGLALVVLSACGPQPATGTDGGSGGAMVALQIRSGLGSVLVDASGKTLYVAEQEAGGMVRCTATCLATWAPVTVDSTSTPRGDSGVLSHLGTVTRPDGRLQITYAGYPLYTDTEDTAPGDVKGDDRYDVFAGVHLRWHVAAYPLRVPTPPPTTGGD